MPDARLSSNVALLNTNQVFTGSNLFDGVVTLTNAANTMAGAFTGNGSGLTSLNAGNLSSGTVPDARLSANVPLLYTNNIFSGSNTFTGDVWANASLHANEMTVNGVLAASALAAPLFTVPSNTYPCSTVGLVYWDANYLYVCTAANTWKRVVLAADTWP